MYDEAFYRMREEALKYNIKRNKDFLRQWCEEAGVVSPVGYGRDYSSKSYVVYTDKPGYLIGKGGCLAEKYTQIIREEFPGLKDIKFVEVNCMIFKEE